MLPFVVKTLICSGLFYVLYYLFLRKETFFHLNRLFLLTALLFSVIIPLLHISIEVATSAPETFFYSLIKGTKELFFVYLLDEVVIYGKASPLSWQNVIEKFYIVGVAVFSVRVLVFLYQILKLNWKAKRYKVGKIWLYVHKKPYTAFSFANIIYVNEEEVKTEYFKVIWKHEIEHIRLGHTYESFLLEIWCCLFWFNPFVWIMRNRLKELHEYQTDSRLIQNGMDSVVYQQHLLDYALDGQSLVAASNFADIALKSRIRMLAKAKSSIWRKAKVSVALPVIIVLLFAFSLDFTSITVQPKPIIPITTEVDSLAIDNIINNLE